MFRHSYYLAGLLGIAHALVDASTVTAVFATVARHPVSAVMATGLVLGYDVLAFAGQPVLGWLADRYKNMRLTMVLGVVLSLVGVILVPVSPVSAAIVAGVGNALFHLGAGAVCVYIRYGKSGPMGVFVGPGALGLAFGIWYGKSGGAVLWPFALLLVGVLLMLWWLALPKTHTAGNHHAKWFDTRVSTPKLALFVLMLSVFVRALVGYAGGYACPTIAPVLFAIAAAGCFGKMIGGVIADRMGWIRTCNIALILAVPLIAFGGGNPYVVGAGLLLFQITTGVTLVALALLMPKYPALAFGLNCLAFLFGAMPTFHPMLKTFLGPPFFVIAGALCIGTVYAGLRMTRETQIVE